MAVNKSKRINELKLTGNLPSPTGIGLKILDVTKNDDVSAQEIADIVNKDPALTGRLLKYANSAYVGFKNPTMSIKEAIVRLGIKTTCRLLLGFSVISNTKTNKCARFNYKEFWAMSLAKAVGAHTLCKITNPIPPDEAFTCGLLSEIGHLAFASVHPEKYNTILSKIEDNHYLDLSELELKEFDITHMDITEALLKEWCLPELGIAAIRNHERLESKTSQEQSKEYKLSQILHITIPMSKIFISNQKDQDQLVPRLTDLIETNGFQFETFSELWGNAVQQWNDWGKIFEIDTQKVPPFEMLTERSKQSSKAEAEKSKTSTDQKNSTNKNISSDQKKPIIQMTSTSIRILIVDDDKTDRKLLSSVLSRAGHEVITATNGKKALEIALTSNPQAIITDWMMPEMDGMELCKALRRADETRQIYIIILTSCEEEEYIIKAFDSGADDYIVKPFQARTLISRIHAAERVVTLQETISHDQKKIQSYLAELSVLNRKLEKLALTDLLTVLPNRRYAMNMLKQEWAFSIRHKKPLTCMMADIDHFKKVNDTYGHDIGDIVLKKTAEVIQKAIRESDIVCRFGGEEFLVICRGTNLSGSRTVGNRICENLRNTKITSKNVSTKITISIGISERTGEMKNTSELLKAADEALYKAKENGRDQVFLSKTLEITQE